MILRRTIKYTVALVFMVLVISCDRDRNTTGWAYFDDMAQSSAYETYTANPNFADGKTMRNPVTGTIPVGYTPYIYAKTDDDRVLAGKELVNNIELNKINLDRGSEVYKIYCSTCHGEKGDGKGFLYTSGKYPFPPANLLSEKIRSNPEGEIYHVTTVGFGVMPQHGSQIRPDDRWKVAMYIKNVLHKN